MTSAQNSLHWKLWSRVCKANDWYWLQGRLLPAAERAASEHHIAVWAAAEQLAAAAHRSPTSDDLRHGCYFYVLGLDKSHKHLDNAEFTRVVRLFKLLCEPDDIDAQIEWMHPEVSERRGLIAFIRKKAPVAYIRSITVDRWGVSAWEDLPITSLRQLSMTLAHRKADWHRPVATDNPPLTTNDEPLTTANCPF